MKSLQTSLHKNLHKIISFVLVLVAVISFAVLAPTASAHTLKTDGTIGALMHVDPNDAPPAGAAATIYFEIHDKAGLFALPSCDCQVSIGNTTTQTVTLPLPAASSLPYVFPTAGVWNVTLTGVPTGGATFSPFTLAYQVEVAPAGSTTPLQKILAGHGVHIVLFGGAIIFALVVILREKFKKPETKPDIKA